MIEATEKTFAEHTASGLVLVDFFTDWCGPCRSLSPILEKLENIKIVKVNVDDCPDVSSNFGIHSIPCLVFLRDGKEVDRTLGLQAQETLQQKIDTLNAGDSE